MAIAWFCTMRRGLSEANKRVCLIQGGAALQIARGLKAPLPRALFRRTRFGVSLDVASLLVHNAAQLALHRFERVVNHLVERLMRAIVFLPLVGDYFMPPCHGHIDATPIGISFLMRVIGLFNGHITAVDVIAKFFQSRCIIQNKIVDLVRFFQTPIRDLNR
jgi:hypothetical protein